MKNTYIITFSDGSTEEITLSISQATYYAHELAYKLAKNRGTEVSTIVKK